MNINRDYLIINDVKKSNITLDNGSMFFYITDKNTQNIFVNLVINVSNNDLIQKYANIENAEDYTLTMNIVKPDNTYKIIEGKLHDKQNAIFEFDLKEDCCDEIGPYKCELLTKCNINGHEEITTSNKLTYKVKSSILNDLDDIVEAPEYPLVIQLFDKLSDIEQYEEDRRANELARQLAEEQRQARFNTLDADMVDRVNAMDSKMDDVEARISAKEQAVDKLIVDTKADIDEYKVAKDAEIDEYKATKDTEINNAITAQDNKINEFINERNDRLNAIEAKNTEQDGRLDVAENRLANIGNDITNTMQPIIDGHTARLDAIEAINVAQNTRLDAIEVKNQQQDDRLLDIEKVNSRQDIDIKCLYGASQTIDITKEGNSIYLQNSNNGFTIIDEIKGNTLVNCNKEPDKELILNGNINTEGYGNVTLTEGVDGGLVDVALEGNTLVNVSKTKDSTALPLEEELTYLYANTQYTLQFISDKATTADITLGGTQLLAQSIVVGLNRISITTPATLVDNNLVISGVGANISEVVVTDTDRKFGYFEGMKSVGECEDLEVKSGNKNLVQTIILGEIDNDTGRFSNSNKAIRSETHLFVKPNTIYTISNDLSYNNYVYEYDINKNFIKLNPGTVNPYTFTTTNDTYYIAFRSTSGQIQNDLNVKYQIEEGSVATDYAPHQSNTQQLTHEPLRAVGDIKDKYVLIDGKWYIERNCGVRAYQEGDIDNYITDMINTVYPLQTPTYEPIDYNPFTVYSEVTHISNNSTIPCNMTIKNTGYNCLLKPSTTYTVSSNLGLNVVTTPSTLTEDCLRFYDTDTSTVTTMKNVTILEGDYTTGKPIPSHFSGIESAFEQEYDEEKGKYKVTAKVIGKNIMNQNSGVYNTDLRSNTICFPVSPNTTYAYSSSNYKDYISVYECTKACPNDSTLSKINNYVVKRCVIISGDNFTTSPTTKYIFMNYDPGSEVQIEQGSIATAYEPYKENNITFYINEPLRGIGDVKDKVYVKNDKVVVERKCGSVTLNGGKNENYSVWVNPNKKPTQNVFVLDKSKDIFKNIAIKSDGYNAVGYMADNFSKRDVSGYGFICQFYNNLHLGLPKACLENEDSTHFKQWLQANPITVVYVLKEPTYEEVEYNDVKLFIESFKNSTLFYNSNVPVTSTVHYSYSVPIVDTVAQTANVTDQQDSMIIDLATQVAVMEMMLM